MSGMAILLLCTLQVDDSGWRSSQPQVGGPASSVGAPAPGASASWGEMNELVDRAQRAIQDGMSSAEKYLR